MVNTRPPRSVRSVFARINSSLSLASSATLPPAAQIWRANTRPSPRDPPVVSAILLVREKRSVRIIRRASQAAKTKATARRKKRPSMFEITIQQRTRFAASLPALQLAVFAIEPRDFAGCFAINRPLFQVSAFVARHFTVRDTELGFEFSVLPIELQDHESASRHLRLAVKLVDLLSMDQQFAD